MAAAIVLPLFLVRVFTKIHQQAANEALECFVSPGDVQIGADAHADLFNRNARGVDFTNTKRKPPHLDLVKCANKRVNSLDRKLPFDAGSVDFVLSCNVIYHGTLGDVRRRPAEIWRVLKPEALYQGTMLPIRNINYESGRQTRRRA